MASQRYMVDLPTDVMCGDFFDHMDDLLDFPNDEDGDFMGGIMETPYIQHGDGGRGRGTPAAFPTLLSPPLRTESECDVGRGVTSPINRTATATATATALDPKGDQLLDDLDIADLEWVSNFMDDSPDSLSLLNFPDAHINGEASTTSPVSVFEEPSSFSGGSASSTTASSSSFSYSGASSGKGPPTHFNFNSPPPPPPLDPIISSVNVPARARSKRSRPPTFSARPHVTIPFFPPPHPELESFGESITPTAPAVKKSKKKNNHHHPPATGAGGEAVRKCMHCEIQKTPQWRAGPMGPKTLCNACGVRYKSGRLFPEYRPAASPTFVPSIHSNSHKKVVEMRINATTHNGPNSCDLLDCIRSGTGVDRARH